MITSSTPWPREPLEHVGDERPVDERDDRLGHGRGQRPQPRALAADEDHRLHQARDRRSRDRARCPRRSRPGGAHGVARRARCARRSTQRRRASPRRRRCQSSSRNSCHSVTSTTASAPATASSAPSAKSMPRHELARLLLGDRVVGARRCAPSACRRAREHERGRLAHVVGVRLERQAEQRDALADERAEVLLQLADRRGASAAR